MDQPTCGAVPVRAMRWTAVIGLLAVALAACSGGSSDGAEPATTTAPAAGSATCAWAAEAGKHIQNIAYPDTSATYWVLSYSLAEGERLVIHGRFARARYLSFITYAPTGGAIGVLADRDIDPDPQSTNPFRGEASAPGGSQRYTISVTGQAVATRPNRLTAVSVPTSPSQANTTAPGPAGTTTTAVDRQAPAKVVLGTGGATGDRGTLIYRVYVPASDGDRTGGVGLPSVSVVAAGGAATKVPVCAHPGPSPGGIAIVEKYGPATDRPAPSTPVFVRPDKGANNLYPNPDNVYVATIVRHRAGEVVVIRGRAPTFADTRAGDAITGDEQVRFWSLCTNEYRKPYPVTDCSRDDQVPLDAQRTFTFVISTPEDRPSNATRANGVTWLDFGSTEHDSVLLFRHMLAADSFAESATKLAPGALAISSMGAYAPRGAYCARTTFEAGGAAACGL